MISRKWILKEGADENLVSQLSSDINVNPYLGSLLIQRGISDLEQAREFFRPDLKHLHDPFLMQDMDRAVNRLSDALFNKERVLIYGDYDVDGTTSVTLLYQFLKEHDHNTVDYYIPDRYDEGYGISEKGIFWAAENEYTLVIALDCGIKAFDNAALAKKLGIDLIICDHHLPGPQLPDAYAILDPKRSDCQYPFDGLCGCGVGFKLLQAFCQQNTIPETDLFEYLDLLAVSITSDLVPIIDENRILTYYGLKKLTSAPSTGLKALKEVSGLASKEIDVQSVVFGIGPRINAAGRIDHAHNAVRLLTCSNELEARALANHVNQHNTRRKEYDQEITEQALADINKELDPAKRSTVLFNKDWHKGVIGIVASRCIENCYRPTIILTESNGKATGSARSVEGFDIYEAIASCSELLEQYGGHKYAAGLTLSLDNVRSLQERFEKVVNSTISKNSLTPKIVVDVEIPLDVISFKFYNVLKQMGPFGPGNEEPIFVSKNLILVGEPRVMKELHLKFYVRDENIKRSFEVIAFNLAHLKDKLIENCTFNLAYHLQETTYMGECSLQLNAKDIHFD